jgi:hypothetical protein
MLWNELSPSRELKILEARSKGKGCSVLELKEFSQLKSLKE